jgi:hypothetical protein
VVKETNRVTVRIALPAPTSPSMRVRTRRFRFDQQRRGPKGDSAANWARASHSWRNGYFTQARLAQARCTALEL